MKNTFDQVFCVSTIIERNCMRISSSKFLSLEHCVTEITDHGDEEVFSFLYGKNGKRKLNRRKKNLFSKCFDEKIVNGFDNVIDACGWNDGFVGTH